MKRIIAIAISALTLSYSATASVNQYLEEFELSVHETFEQTLDNWVIEKTQASVTLVDGTLDIDDAAGTTVWFKHDIGTPSIIEFDGAVVVAGGANDRGTDLNWFWMAQDVTGADFFANSERRAGDMRQYDNMRLYYIGYGANDNSTTRFRRYPGDGTRPLLPEYDVFDPQFMNTANVMTKIHLVNLADRIEVYANGKLLYRINDKTPFHSGKFGFRTWKSHLKLDDFKVYTIKPN